ncbi:helix-turn-helix domain-containing protein [Cryobacterium tagatosivorans]
MGRRGRKRNLNREDEYWKLILAGIGPIAAATRVGIGRTTCHRWRSQRGGIAPLRLAEADRHERHLNLIERDRIALFRREGCSIREISRRLGRSPSTISREVRRNMRKHDRGQYELSWPTPAPERRRAGRELAASGKTSSSATWSRRS